MSQSPLAAKTPGRQPRLLVVIWQLWTSLTLPAWHPRHSERRIDLIHERLSGIERLLRDLSSASESHDKGRTKSTSASASASATSSPSVQIDRTSPENASQASSRDASAPADDASPMLGIGEIDPVSESAFAGDSSFAAHTVLASEFIEVAVRSSRFQDQLNPNIYSALASLRQIVSLQKRQIASHETFRWPRQRPVPPGGLSQMPMPPVSIVVERLRQLQGMYFSPPPAAILVPAVFLPRMS